jgi:hypothetical protein
MACSTYQMDKIKKPREIKKAKIQRLSEQEIEQYLAIEKKAQMVLPLWIGDLGCYYGDHNPTNPGAAHSDDQTIENPTEA